MLLTALNRSFALRLSSSLSDKYGKMSRKFYTCMPRINKTHCQSHFTKVVKDSASLKISLFTLLTLQNICINFDGKFIFATFTTFVVCVTASNQYTFGSSSIGNEMRKEKSLAVPLKIHRLRRMEPNVSCDQLRDRLRACH